MHLLGGDLMSAAKPIVTTSFLHGIWIMTMMLLHIAFDLYL